MVSATTAAAETTKTLAPDDITSVPAYLVNSGISSEFTELVTKGEFSKAETWLSEQITSATADRKQVFSTELQRLRHLQRDYNSTPTEMLRKIRKEVPTATEEDLEKWRIAGAIQWIPVNGEPRYFRREPGNLFRFDKRAQVMQKAAKKSKTSTGDPAAASKKYDLDKHLVKVIATAKEKKTTEILPVTFHVKHTIVVKPNVVPVGETIRCWFPYPQNYRQQTEPLLIKKAPAIKHISPSGTAMRTVCMEQPANAAGEPTTFTLEYNYTSAAYYPDLKKPSKQPHPPAGEEFLAEQAPHIKFTPELRKLAADIVGNETDPLAKAQKIWSWFDLNVKWAAEMEYATLPNIVQKVSTCMRGDCGTQALMFVTLCRISGVPARWQSGWVTKPKDWNMHDWAEFYTPEFGWLPADPSVGRRKSKEPALRDYMFGHLDAYRMVANLDWGKQFVPAKQFDRSDPVDNQRGEVEWSGGNLYYDDWSYDVQVK